MVRPKTSQVTPSYFFAGGGTAGHVNPALAVAKALTQIEADARITFLVTREGMEKDLVREAGYEYVEIDAAPLSKSPLTWWPFVQKNLKGLSTARRSLKEAKAQAVIGTGGFVSVPLILAARQLGIPYILHEQNALPGRSNRLLAKRASYVGLSFPDTEKYFPKLSKGKFVFTGNPVKSAFYENSQEEARQELGISSQAQLLVVIGGSLGSKSINQAIQGLSQEPAWESFINDYPNFQIVLSAGKVNKLFLDEQIISDRILIEDYLDTGLWIPAADFLLGRASGGFLAESAVAGKASIVVPFPQAADDHQTYNGKVFAEQGASLMIKDNDLNSRDLLAIIRQLLSQPENLKQMGQAATLIGKKDAAYEIANLLIQARKSR